MILDNGKYYLYRHVRLDNGDVFYVGIGKKRAKNPKNNISSYGRAFDNKNRNQFWHRVVDKSDYEVEIILESNELDFIFKKEIEFIKLYGRRDLSSGTLVNLTDGGVGIKNISHVSIKKIIETKRIKGNLCNIKNIRNWEKSEKYKNPRSRCVYVYSKDGMFFGKFNSLKSFGDYVGSKGSISFISTMCNKKRIYNGKYLLSWIDKGASVNLDEYIFDKVQMKVIYKICPFTKSILYKFDKVTDASIAEKMDIRNISSALKRKTRCNGSYWIYESELKNISNISFSSPTRPVIGINEQGETIKYFSANEAEKHLGATKGNLCNAIKRNHKCKGYNWRYAVNQQNQSSK